MKVDLQKWLRLYEQLMRIDSKEGAKKACEEAVRRSKTTGRKKMRWWDKVRNDMTRKGLMEEYIFDRRY